MSRRHVVREGECAASIAAEAGLPLDTVWLDPANAALRGRRTSPYQLAPGDVVAIPDQTVGVETIPTTRRSRFVRHGIPEVVRVRLLDEDGKPLEGVVTFTTEGSNGCVPMRNGIAEIPVQPSDRAASISVDTETGILSYDLQIGSLRPATGSNLTTRVRAAQARLNNLGYDCGPEDGRLGPSTRAMLRAFQLAHGLPGSGRLDRETARHLVELHGC